jgi:hypothetical protein
MDPGTRKRLEERLYEEVDTIFTVGDRDYLCSLSRHALGKAIEDELRFLGLYAYEDRETPAVLHTLIEQHLDHWRHAYLAQP